MPTPTAVQRLETQRSELQARLVAVRDLRPGSLTERFRRCGKPGCACAHESHPGHGPSFSLTRAVAGKTVTKIIPAAAVEQTRAQIEEHRRFRALASAFVEVNEKLCDSRLREQRQAAEDAVEKRGSARRSTPKRWPRSKRS